MGRALLLAEWCCKGPFEGTAQILMTSYILVKSRRLDKKLVAQYSFLLEGSRPGIHTADAVQVTISVF